MFIRDEGRGTLLTDVPEFCTSEPKDQQDCVTSLKSGGPECVSLHLIDHKLFRISKAYSTKMML